jgi:hypothetical protein
MNELTVVDKAAEWRRMKSLVLDSVSSPITKRVYSMALDEFFDWYRLEPRPGFSKATVNAWRVTLDERGLGSSSIIVRMSAIRKLAVEAMDNGLLAPELAAGIQRVKSAKTLGVRTGNWLNTKRSTGAPERARHFQIGRPARPRHHRRAARQCATPVRSGGSRRWALFGRIYAGGDGRRTARGCAEVVGPSSRALRVLGAAGVAVGQPPPECGRTV